MERAQSGHPMPHTQARVFLSPGMSSRGSASLSTHGTGRAPHLPAQRRLVALSIGRAVRPAARRGRGAAAVGAGGHVGPRRAGRERGQARALGRAEALQLRGGLVGGRACALRRRLRPRTLLPRRAPRAPRSSARRGSGEALAGRAGLCRQGRGRAPGRTAERAVFRAVLCSARRGDAGGAESAPRVPGARAGRTRLSSHLRRRMRAPSSCRASSAARTLGASSTRCTRSLSAARRAPCGSAS
jgi:hypothetical protein